MPRLATAEGVGRLDSAASASSLLEQRWEQGAVLIVEDEPLVAMEASASLEDLGFQVCATAFSAEDAIAQARARQPDLVLMDLNLGRGPDGIQAAQEIRAIHPGIGLVFVTAYADAVNRSRMAELAPDGIVTKPYTEADLALAVKRALAARRSRQA